MAISVSYNGSTIYRPGAYSRRFIDLGGNLPLGPAGLIAIVGEADAGAPGNAEVDIKQNFYSADTFADARAKYRSGPIVDALNFLFAPASDGAIPNGAQVVWVYKTNASLRASLALANSYGSLRALEWGVGGNRATAKVSLSGAGQAEVISPVINFNAQQLSLGGGTPVDGSVLAVPPTGYYFDVSSDLVNYRVWFNAGSQTAPSAAGKTLVPVVVGPSDTTAQVLTALKAALEGLSGLPFWASIVSSDIFIKIRSFGSPLFPSSIGTVPATGAISAVSGSGHWLNSRQFSFRYNGGSVAGPVTLSGSEANHDTLAEIVSELNGLGAFNASLIASEGSGADAGKLVIRSAVVANKNRDGFSEVVELIDSTAGDLSAYGLAAGVKLPSAEPRATVRIEQKRDLLVEEVILGGNAVLAIGHDGSGGVTSATVSVSATQVTLTTNLGSQVLDKAAFTTLRQLADSIDILPGWEASVVSAVYNSLPLLVLDQVSLLPALQSASGVKPVRIKKDAFEVASFFAQSSVVEVVSQAAAGLPDALIETFLAGGVKGGTLSSDVVDGLAKFEKFHVNSIVPLFSRDAAQDIADSLTDASSSYTIDGIHQAVKTHVSLMKTTKKRSERQGYLSLKKSYAASKVVAGNLADARLQLVIQDIRQIDAAGSIKWFQPYAFACLLAGARGGAPIGLPMTFKFLNCSGLRHTAQPMTTAEASIAVDFDADTQYDDAIQSGITFMESPQTGGFRVVVDNTTYGIDDNWLYNRANVLYAADIVEFNFRNAMEARYVGVKNTVRASEVKATAESVLGTFLSQGITVSTASSPQGFKNLSVRIEGSTVYVSVTITLLEGIDFVLNDISLQRATQTA
jgi:hypothetical protein